MQYKFLIYISHSYSVPIGKPLEKVILETGHTLKWFADKDEGMQKIKHFDDALLDIQSVVDYRPDIVLVATNVVADFISGIKVQIFHGFNAQKRPSKKTKFSHFKIRGFFDLYCTQGPSTTKYFKELANKHGYFKVVETGWPKMDPLYPLTDHKPLSSTQSSKIRVLISSTFSKRMSLALNHELYLEIQRLIQTNKYCFFMTLHPKLPQQVVDKWKLLENENFHFHDSTDLIPVFKQAQVMLADATSAIQEFILQNKPVIAFRNNIKPNYFINIDEVEEIENAINLQVQDIQVIHKNREAYCQQLHPYKDGQSSQRVVDVSVNFLEMDKRALKAKPLNWMRKLKIRKQLKYFPFKSNKSS